MCATLETATGLISEEFAAEGRSVSRSNKAVATRSIRNCIQSEEDTATVLRLWHPLAQSARANGGFTANPALAHAALPQA